MESRRPSFNTKQTATHKNNLPHTLLLIYSTTNISSQPHPAKGEPPLLDPPLPESPLKPTPPRFLLWRSMRAERPRDLIRVSGEEADTLDGGPPFGSGLRPIKGIIMSSFKRNLLMQQWIAATIHWLMHRLIDRCNAWMIDATFDTMMQCQ